MYGLEAINANNGWAISVVGITIVFSGLVMLSLVISQLHKLIALYEHPEKLKKIFTRAGTKEKAAQSQEETIPLDLTPGQKEIFRQFALLVRTMEDHFSLSRLLFLAQISGLKDPHSNLNLLLKSGIIFADKKGLFCWNQDLFDQSL
ncbi:OadG family protein [Desulfospira joergensenii]|uniref:OadG family protein n=1 Tax=Desulfospira joergensenii TaxID=53329 RepID=UPI0003B43FD1|nr:OadG family protein [Desulfospira joergensenii]